MRTLRFHFLFAGVLGSLLMVMPTQLLAAGGWLNKIAEQLGLRLGRLTSEPKVGDRLVLRVVNPERLAAYGLRDLRSNAEVEVTILSDEQVSVAPATLDNPKARVAADAPRLVVAMDKEGTIEQMQIVQEEVRQPLAADRLQPVGEAPAIEPSR